MAENTSETAKTDPQRRLWCKSHRKCKEREMKGAKSCLKPVDDDRRDKIERRAYQYTFYLPERRIKQDRRDDSRN